MTDDLPDPPIADSVDPSIIGDHAPADGEPEPIDDTVLRPDETDDEEADSGPAPGEGVSVAPGVPPAVRIVDGVRADAVPVMPEREDVRTDRVTEWEDLGGHEA
jgi:hypothetical protein